MFKHYNKLFYFIFGVFTTFMGIYVFLEYANIRFTFCHSEFSPPFHRLLTIGEYILLMTFL